MDSSYWYLLASLIGFLLGPIFYSILANQKKWFNWIDGFSMTSVGGIVLIHLFPELIEKGGLLTLIFVLLAILIPKLLETIFLRKANHSKHYFLLVGMFLHTIIESAALGTVQGEELEHLGLAIVLHRLPVGMLLFSYLLLQRGKRFAILVIISLFLSSIIGFGLGSFLHSIISPTLSILLEVFVSASLLHVAWDNHHSQPHIHSQKDVGQPSSYFQIKDSQKIFSGMGAFLGILLIVIVIGSPKVSRPGGTFSLSFLQTFLTYSLESAPALCIGYLLAGILKSNFELKISFWNKKGNIFLKSLQGVLFGLPLPVCSCGVLPIYESLVKKGIPIATGVGFLIATPELGIDAILLSIPMLGKELTIARILIAFAIAVFVSILMGKILPDPIIAKEENLEKKDISWKKKFLNSMEFGFGELFDHTISWILLGLYIAALLEPLLEYGSFSNIPDFYQVPLFALIGIPFYVCATGATPLAAMAIHKGISTGAAIAFLISGPATNITTFAILSKLYNKKIAFYFGLLVTISSIFFGWVINFIGLQTTPELHTNSEKTPGLLQILCLAFLSALLFTSILRQGPRGIVKQITNPIHSH